MSDKLLPDSSLVVQYKSIGEIDNAIAVTNEGEYVSASALATLGGRFPGSRAGIYKMADREGWRYINLPGKGAKDGVKYFKVDLSGIDEFLGSPREIRALNKQHYASKDRVSYKLDNLETLFIEHYLNIKGAAGAGQATPTDQLVLNVAVNAADWRNYVGLDHRHVKIISIHGDSMKPTFNHGDQVLVDTACNRLIDDGVYAFMQDDLLRVKRIKLKLNGDIEVKSDNGHGFTNETYTQQEATDFIVFGRVLPFKFGKVDL